MDALYGHRGHHLERLELVFLDEAVSRNVCKEEQGLQLLFCNLSVFDKLLALLEAQFSVVVCIQLLHLFLQVGGKSKLLDSVDVGAHHHLEGFELLRLDKPVSRNIG